MTSALYQYPVGAMFRAIRDLRGYTPQGNNVEYAKGSLLLLVGWKNYTYRRVAITFLTNDGVLGTSYSPPDGRGIVETIEQWIEGGWIEEVNTSVKE